MSSSKPNSELFELAREASEGLVCHCGNSDWKQFLWVMAPPAGLVASRKRCARSYTRIGAGPWKEVTP